MDAQVTHRADDDFGERVRVGEVFVHRATLARIEERFVQAVEARKAHQVVTVNLQFLSEARRVPGFADIVNRAHLVVPDGMPVVWLAKMQGTPLSARITGHDLLALCARLSAERRFSLFLLGPSAQVAAVSRARLEEMYPGVHVVGNYEGRFTQHGYGATADDERGAVEAIRAAKPDFLLVALGCPKQDYWIARHLHEVDAPVAIGVGSVFDVLAGRNTRAPQWMQRSGLEWAHRLGQDPGRLWRRYLTEAAPTVFRLGISAFAQRVSRATHARP